MNLSVDPEDPTPPYEQLRRQLADLVDAGTLVAGERLPPLRQLAGDLGLAVGTVARAYRELEGAGLLTSRRGGGTRVAERARPAPEVERRARLAELSAAHVRRTQALGFTPAEIAIAVGAALDNSLDAAPDTGPDPSPGAGAGPGRPTEDSAPA